MTQLVKYVVLVTDGEDLPDIIGPFDTEVEAERYRAAITERFGWIPDDTVVLPLEAPQEELTA